MNASCEVDPGKAVPITSGEHVAAMNLLHAVHAATPGGIAHSQLDRSMRALMRLAGAMVVLMLAAAGLLAIAGVLIPHLR